MRKEIKISEEKNSNIEHLFMSYSAYMSMLQYLAENGVGEGTDFYDKKWKEAVDLWIKLDKAKRAVEKEYKPAGEWDRYEFDFENQQVIFIKE